MTASVTLNDEQILESASLEMESGYVGLYGAGPAAFDNVSIETRTEE